MTEIFRLAIWRIIAILSTQIGLFALIFGYYDFANGTPPAATEIEICTADCSETSEKAPRAILSASNDRTLLNEVFGTTDLCEIPPLLLTNASQTDVLDRSIEALSVEGIANITKSGETWKVSAGYAVDSWIDPAVKLISPRMSDKTCQAPLIKSYGFWGLFFFSLAVVLMLLAPQKPRNTV